MTTFIRLERSFGNDFVAYLDGHGAPLLRKVPGNTEPARRWTWPSVQEAARDLLEVYGPGTSIKYREDGGEWKAWC